MFYPAYLMVQGHMNDRLTRGNLQSLYFDDEGIALRFMCILINNTRNNLQKINFLSPVFAALNPQRGLFTLLEVIREPRLLGKEARSIAKQARG